MSKRFLPFCAPAYLLFCIVLGGSKQGIWANAALQIVGVGLLLWIFLHRHNTCSSGSLKLVGGIVSITLGVIALQLLPLPPRLWTSLPGRELLVEGYGLLKLQLPWLPLSQAPYATVDAALALLPPLAMIVTVQLQDSEKYLAGTLLGTVAAIILGQLQVGVTGGPWRFYEITNPGPVGFFANINHMATLMLASVPFSIALLLGRTQQRGSTAYSAWQASLVALILAILLIGIILNASLAAILLSGPVLLASALLLPSGWRWRMFVSPLAGVALIAAIYALSADPLGSATESEASSVASRLHIWATTIKAIEETFPFGTGLGSFQYVYSSHEDPRSVTEAYVNHAHNDYLEVLLELGAAGIVIVVLFLIWWTWRLLCVWRSDGSPFERAATIASAAVLAHSVVDYPLRTAAIAAVFGMCVGLMARER